MLSVVIAVSGCSLFDTDGSETAIGRGSKSFDPYAGPQSGAIRLSLQMFNGCAVRANGEPFGKGSANIPYPTDCGRYEYQDPLPPNPPPSPPMRLLAGTTYFLSQLTIMDFVDGAHTDPNNTGAVSDWMKTQTRFAKLDWTGLEIVRDEFAPSNETLSPYAYDHVVEWGNANWQLATNDTWTLEVLDADQRVVASMVYDRSDFLAENPFGGHTQLRWINGNIGRPQFPGDVAVHALPPAPPGYPPPFPTVYRSFVRYEQEYSTHPTKSFKLDPGLAGDGAIRMTWSQLPSAPFYFPVTFAHPQDVPATCFAGGDVSQPVSCGYGLQPEAHFSPPKNGTYYQPGETLFVRLAAKDGAGNYLHPVDHFPSWNDYMADASNGLLYFNLFHLYVMQERDIITGWQLSGPKQAMRPPYELNTNEIYMAPTEQYVVSPEGNDGIIPISRGAIVALNAAPGARAALPPTAYIVNLPKDIRPGTYTLYWKVNREFMGERFTKMLPFDIQVGTATATQYPGRIGNCQICHRGAISLEDIWHGMPVDYVEGCIPCHQRNVFSGGRDVFQKIIHDIHMSSKRYSLPKNDCTVCHLTRESAVRPSYVACVSCHPQPHGTMYWDLPLNTDQLANEDNTVFGNCAQQCHGMTVPTQHVLPRE
jgi:hypothetical protein